MVPLPLGIPKRGVGLTGRRLDFEQNRTFFKGFDTLNPESDEDLLEDERKMSPRGEGAGAGELEA